MWKEAWQLYERRLILGIYSKLSREHEKLQALTWSETAAVTMKENFDSLK